MFKPVDAIRVANLVPHVASVDHPTMPFNMTPEDHKHAVLLFFCAEPGCWGIRYSTTHLFPEHCMLHLTDEEKAAVRQEREEREKYIVRDDEGHCIQCGGTECECTDDDLGM